MTRGLLSVFWARIFWQYLPKFAYVHTTDPGNQRPGSCAQGRSLAVSGCQFSGISNFPQIGHRWKIEHISKCQLAFHKPTFLSIVTILWEIQVLSGHCFTLPRHHGIHFNQTLTHFRAAYTELDLFRNPAGNAASFGYIPSPSSLFLPSCWHTQNREYNLNIYNPCRVRV